VIGLAQKIGSETAGYQILLGDNPVLFTPGFSQVNCAKQRLETVFKGFLFS